MKVISPWSAEDCRGLLKASIRDPNVTVFLENEILYGQSFPVTPEILSDDFVLPIGKAKVERVGKDITLVAHSIAVNYCMAAAEQLKKEEGIEVEVINLRSIRPLDINTIIDSVKKTNHLVTVECGFPSYSVGSEIIANIMESDVSTSAQEGRRRHILTRAPLLTLFSPLTPSFSLSRPPTTLTTTRRGSPEPTSPPHTPPTWRSSPSPMPTWWPRSQSETCTDRRLFWNDMILPDRPG
jgi:pyruvate dehydrogenase E1 component beta subunit